MKLVVLLVFVALGLPAEALRLTPLPEAAARPASGPALDRTGLVDLALLFSGTSPGAVPAYRTVVDRWSQEFLATDAARAEKPKRAEALLQFLHKRLKSYSTNQTRLDVMVDRGTFNCVSSALAFMILGRDAGLDVQAVATEDHAFALVRLDDGREVDVETTTPFGFDPGTKTEFTNSFGQTGFAYVPPGNYTARKTIGDRQLLGLLVQNRMADHQRAGKAEDAVGPAIDRWTIEGTPEAYKTLIDGFTNYASWLNGRREYLKGLDIVEQMVVWTGPSPEAKELAWKLLNNAVVDLTDKQDWAGAQAVTAAWRTRNFLTDAQAYQTHSLITDRQLGIEARTLPFRQAAERIDQAAAQGLISGPRRQELISFVYGQEAQRTASAQGAQAAWLFLGALPAEIRGLGPLAKTREVYAYNWSIEVHNQFAKAWNGGFRDQALRILEEALAALPDSRLLKNDLAQVQASP